MRSLINYCQFSESTSQIQDLLVSQGTVLGAIFDRTRTSRDQNRGSLSSSERNSNRFSGVSILDSARSSKNFDFGDEIVNARVYRRALTNWVARNREEMVSNEASEVEAKLDSESLEDRKPDGEGVQQHSSPKNDMKPSQASIVPSTAGFIFPFSQDNTHLGLNTYVEGGQRDASEGSTLSTPYARQLPTVTESDERDQDDADNVLGHPEVFDSPRNQPTSAITTQEPQKVAPRKLTYPRRDMARPGYMSKFLREYKLVVVGGGGVDKSSLTIQVKVII